MSRIDVLLATYQNADYLPALMDSLAAQTTRDFRLLVSDDCSTDKSADIAESYAGQFERFQLIRRPTQSGSAKANFNFLLKQADADYVLFADGDDVWDKDKVARIVSLLERGDAEFGKDVPHYSYSDARLINGSGDAVASSYWKYKKMRPSARDSKARSLICPPMLGCTSGINRALCRLASPMPVTEITGHDWFLLLLATFCGNVSILDDQTISYRLHGNNSSSQKPVNIMKYIRSADKLSRVRGGMNWRYRQAAAVLAHIDTRLCEGDRILLETFTMIPLKSPFRRRWELIKNHILYPDLPRNLALLLGV